VSEATSLETNDSLHIAWQVVKVLDSYMELIGRETKCSPQWTSENISERV
jgi:hypothetical protein